MSDETVSALWVGPFEGERPDRTVLVPHQTVVELPRAEAEGSDHWKVNGQRQSAGSEKSAEEKATEADQRKAEKAAETKAAREAKAAEEARAAHLEAEAARERQDAASLDAQADRVRRVL